MADLTLVKMRPCDGACCKESPRWPNEDGTDCIYHDIGGCKIKRGQAEIPKGDCPVIDMSAEKAFEMWCVEWPQKHSEKRLGETANCCWQWVENGN